MSCGCSSDKKRLIYACSGAANTGYLADQVARRLSLQGEGKMTCLAGIGADLSGFLDAAGGAETCLIIDGCSMACGKKAFDRHGLPCTALDLTKFGVEKGVTVIDETVIQRMTETVMATCGSEK